MTAINSAFNNALLADASYGDDLSGTNLADALTNRMTPKNK